MSSQYFLDVIVLEPSDLMPHTFFFLEFPFHFARECAVLCFVAHS